MFNMHQLTVSAALLATVSSSAFAFFDELVVGATSVTNNLISSSASVTNNTVNTASTTMISLSSNPGKMADRIGLMADRIGYMADRIVTTEGLMAGLAHKIIDSNTQPRVVHQYASAYGPAPTAMPSGYQPVYATANANANVYATTVYAPHTVAHSQASRGNPYLVTPAPAAPAPSYGYAQPPHNGYSASQMIYGVAGSTYTAARPAPAPVANAYQPGYASDYGFSTRPAVLTAGNSCGVSYGVPRKC